MSHHPAQFDIVQVARSQLHPHHADLSRVWSHQAVLLRSSSEGAAKGIHRSPNSTSDLLVFSSPKKKRRSWRDKWASEQKRHLASDEEHPVNPVVARSKFSNAADFNDRSPYVHLGSRRSAPHNHLRNRDEHVTTGTTGENKTTAHIDVC